MKTLNVTCAIIRRNGSYLVAQRAASMSRPLQWEFVGGKIHEGETPEQCIVREVKEELCLDVRVTQRLADHVYSYDDKTVCLIPFECEITGGSLQLLEHNDGGWKTPEQMRTLDWCSADRAIVDRALGAAAPA
jgi:8-oxo-dGTP diphosphatase